CLSAEAVVFNSDFHRREFLLRLPKFLPRLPNYDPRWVADTITAKAEVLPLGLDVAALERSRRDKTSAAATPRILWNHRWESDKQPEMFFAALEALASAGVRFTADVVGESFERRPPVFDAARERLGSRIGRFGFVESRDDYVRCLWDADVVVSTARQEFFGIAMAEAVLCGAHPIAPRGLVYADLYAGPCASRHLYRDQAELVTLLRRALEGERSHDCGLGARLCELDWPAVARRFDARLRALTCR